MKIVIDLDEIILNDITLDQYYLLTLIYFKKLDLLIQYTDKYGEFKISDIELLKRRELIDFVEFKGDITSVSITEKGSSIIHKYEEVIKTKKVQIEDFSVTVNEMEFIELCSTYPTKTINGRRLQSNINAVTKDKFKETYTKNLRKTKCTHSQVIDAIKLEKATRLGDNAKFFNMLSTYINQGLWVGYIDKTPKQPNEQYGHMKAL